MEMNQFVERLGLQPVSLEDAREAGLMDRTDTKYLLPERLLPELLEGVRDRYMLQVVAGKGAGRYHTVYYDTPGLDMYLMHHNGKLNREKIRVRTYVDSAISFLEVKRKTNKGRTMKERMPVVPGALEQLAAWEGATEFMDARAGYAPENLLPQIRNQFWRATLVRKDKMERITIDWGLNFAHCQTGRSAEVHGLVVVELKRDGRDADSLMASLLSGYHIRPQGMSKYCLGTVLTNSEAKNNRYKTKLRHIHKLTNYAS